MRDRFESFDNFPKKFLLTFASLSMKRSADRLVKQAKSLNFYDTICSLSEQNLPHDFRLKYKNFLIHGSRGYGYWCWKPQVIRQTLETMSTGDILQYTDAGCHLNPNGIRRLEEYFKLAENSRTGVLAFQLKDPDPPLDKPKVGALDLPDYQWVKGDLLDYFDVRNRKDIVNTQTIGAGIIFIRKCAESMALIRQWQSVFAENFNLIDDTESVAENLPGFREHRHDQAIFSIICKLAQVETVSAYEYWYPSRTGSFPDWKVLNSYPIHAKRDKDFGILGNFSLIFKKIYSRCKRLIFKSPNVIEN